MMAAAELVGSALRFVEEPYPEAEAEAIAAAFRTEGWCAAPCQRGAPPTPPGPVRRCCWLPCCLDPWPLASLAARSTTSIRRALLPDVFVRATVAPFRAAIVAKLRPTPGERQAFALEPGAAEQWEPPLVRPPAHSTIVYGG